MRLAHPILHKRLWIGAGQRVSRRPGVRNANRNIAARIVWGVSRTKVSLKRGVPMKAIAALLIVVGIVGLVFSAIFPAILGIPGIIGSLALLLTGLGFFMFCCGGFRK